MGRSPCCSKEGMNRGAWTAIEDKILTDYIKLNGEGKWRNIPKEAGLKRCGKSCRLRWMNYLRPDIKRGNISPDEEDLIIRLHKLLGNRWSLIAGRLPGRTDNEIKNYWNTHLSKKGQAKKCRRPPKSNPSKPAEKKNENPNSSLCVIRTKASRCKEVFIIENHDRTVGKPQSNEANSVDSANTVPAELTESSDGSLITAFSSCKEQNSLDFMAGMNNNIAAGETSLSEIFASDFTKLGHDLDVSEMEHNWRTGTDHYIQANLDSDFGSLVALLESAEDWLI